MNRSPPRIAEIDTFIKDVSTTRTNIAAASNSISLRLVEPAEQRTDRGRDSRSRTDHRVRLLLGSTLEVAVDQRLHRWQEQGCSQPADDRPHFSGGVSGQMMQQVALGGAMSSEVVPPAEQEQIATALEEDAEVMTNSQLEERIIGQPAAVEAEVLAINHDARNLSLQVALLVPLLAGLVGLGNSFRMTRLPDQNPKTSLDGMDFG